MERSVFSLLYLAGVLVFMAVLILNLLKPWEINRPSNKCVFIICIFERRACHCSFLFIDYWPYQFMSLGPFKTTTSVNFRLLHPFLHSQMLLNLLFTCCQSYVHFFFLYSMCIFCLFSTIYDCNVHRHQCFKRKRKRFYQVGERVKHCQNGLQKENCMRHIMPTTADVTRLLLLKMSCCVMMHIPESV